MGSHAITLHLPENLYRRFRQRAKWSRRSLETELLDAVASAETAPGGLSQDLLAAVDGLGELEDGDLWRMATTTMSSQQSEQLETLHARQRDAGLSQEEDALRANLIHEYERVMLVRAQAAKILKDRGHDVSKILASR